MGTVWVIGTTWKGETIEFGYPMDETLNRITQDCQHFATIEIVGIDYNL